MATEPPGPSRFRRWLDGDPPVEEPAEMVSRYGFFAAWLLGVVAIVGGGPGLGHRTLGLIAPAGLLLILVGVIRVTNYRGVRDRDRLREESGLSFRLTENRSATAFAGAVLVVIGLCWFVFGVTAI
jgi:hypothetical protein